MRKRNEGGSVAKQKQCRGEIKFLKTVTASARDIPEVQNDKA